MPSTICAAAGSRERRYWCLEFPLVLWLWWLALPSGAVVVNDVEEARLTAGLAEGMTVGRVIRLQQGARAFAAVLRETRATRKKGLVILLPEAGMRADAGLSGKLQQAMTEHGWSVLTLQLPVLEPEAHPREYWPLVEEAAGRVEFAVTAMQGEGMGNIALAGHGFGAVVVMKYLGQGKAATAVRAAILLSPWWPAQRASQLHDWLNAVKVPVLDVYAEADAREIRQTARQRHLILKGREGYRQWRITGVGHHYRGREMALAKRIYGWLERVAPGVEVKIDE